jgi:peptidyl-prolyl cis-trans isomerase SurA
MAKHILILLLVAFIFPLTTSAQKGGPVVFTVDTDTIWGAEFERVFNKNNRNPELKPSMEELEEYQNLYVRFKLKVKEAYRLGMDTNEAYVKELAGYRKQLSQPYLTDKTITERLIKEAYDRMQYEVDASNLMIHLSPVANPADTLEAWLRINKWRDLIVSGEIPFDRLTMDSSSDEHGRTKAGRLGYFSTFNMIYSFENQAYNTPVGEVSPVFRTTFGYHVVKVNDVRETRGDLKVAHILIRINNEADYELNRPRIDAIYDRLKNGESWDQLVMDFSEDFNTRERNGELNWLKSIGGNVPKAFREASYGLKDGSYSEPVKSELGWHIIKRIEKKPMLSYDDLKESIKLKIARDARSELNKEAVLARIKGENDFVVYEKNWVEYVSQLDTTALTGVNWIAPERLQSDSIILFTIGKKDFSNADFSTFIQQNPVAVGSVEPEYYANRLFTTYCDNQNMTYEESILEEKYPDFKYLMQEYHDGILLFELTNEKVWSKATEDTTGLKKFFEDNGANYTWKDRAVTRLYTCSDAKTAKKVKKALAAGKTDEEMNEVFNKKNPLALKITEKIIERGKDSTMDALNWDGGLQSISDAGNTTTYVRFDTIIPAGPKLLKEAMGPVTSDYQGYLEDAWIAELKKRYKLEINQGALSQLFSNIKP